MKEEAFHRLFERWRSLPAFAAGAARLSRTTLIVRHRQHAQSTGEGSRYPGGRRFEILRVGRDFTDARAVLLHEMAHIVDPWANPHHGQAWRTIFLMATYEMLFLEAGSARPSAHDYHESLAEMIRGAESVLRRRRG